MISANIAGVTDCGPSDQASCGRGWTSMIKPSAPIALDADFSESPVYNHLEVAGRKRSGNPLASACTAVDDKRACVIMPSDMDAFVHR